MMEEEICERFEEEREQGISDDAEDNEQEDVAWPLEVDGNVEGGVLCWSKCFPWVNVNKLRKAIFLLSLLENVIAANVVSVIVSYVDVGLDIYFIYHVLYSRGYYTSLALSATSVVGCCLLSSIYSNIVSLKKRPKRKRDFCLIGFYFLLDFPLPWLRIAYISVKEMVLKWKLFCKICMSVPPDICPCCSSCCSFASGKARSFATSETLNPHASQVEMITYWKHKWKKLCIEDHRILRLGLIESLVEAMPQFMINIYVMLNFGNVETFQIINTSVSFLSLVWGLVLHQKIVKEYLYNVQTGKLKPPNGLGFAQMLLIFLYKALLLGSRFLCLVYFSWVYPLVTLAFVIPHYFIVFVYMIAKRHWDGTLLNKKDKWVFCQHMIKILINSLLNIFIYYRETVPANVPLYGEQIAYYILYTVENIMLITLPMGKHMQVTDPNYRYIAWACGIGMLLGYCVMILYYLCVHKSSEYIRRSYCRCCFPETEKIPCLNYHTRAVKHIHRDLIFHAGEGEEVKKLNLTQVSGIQYEKCLQEGKCLLIAPGTKMEIYYVLNTLVNEQSLPVTAGIKG